MRHGELAANAGDVDEGPGASAEHVRQRGLSGVDGGEEISGHCAVKSFEGLVFEGANLDDSGVVDKYVDTAEVIDAVLDEFGGLGGVGEIDRNEEDIVGRANSPAGQKSLAGGGKLVVVAGGEDEFCSVATVALCKSEAEAARASRDEDHLDSSVFTLGSAGAKGVGDD